MKTLLKPGLFLLFLLLFAGLYVIKVETWQLQRKVHRREREVERIEREIDVLRAEQAYLARPERIEKLARRYLHMHPPKPKQIIVLEK